MDKIMIRAAVAALLLTACTARQERLTDYVNPFVGTDYHGHTFPGAATPFGMVQLSPDTHLEGWDWCSGYHYSDSSIIGFSHTHLTGTGRSDLMDVMLMPAVGKVRLNAGTRENPDSGYRSRFSHDREWASPGYYKVHLSDYDIMAELTATPRCGLQRYTFPASDSAYVILDLSHHYATDSVKHTALSVLNDSVITGERITKGWGDPGEKYWSNQKLYFAMQVSRPADLISVYSEDKPVSTGSASGTQVKAVLHYRTAAGEPLSVKVGISAVSTDNALLNLHSELPGWDFDRVAEDARRSWEEKLSRIRTEASDTEKRVFYTALYHSFLAPYLYCDVNSEYRGSDDQVHTASFDNYTVFSLWDTFRAANPLIGMLNPEEAGDMICSMLAQYDEYGLLPVWSLWSSETNCMIGYHAIPVITDAYLKGIRGFDADKAYEAMKHSAMQEDFGVGELKRYGYIPYDRYNKSVSTALEYCFDDWCIAQMAKSLGHDEDYGYFMQRAQSYVTYFDREYGLMNGVSSAGKFRRPFDPFYSSYGACDWIEGNSWQYSFFVPHDVQGLIGLHGGDAEFVAALDTLFTIEQELSGSDVPIDITGLIGQYAHGNEPSHHVAYLYNYAGRPDRAQSRLHRIMTELYSDAPDGLCGNEDCGQMSAWYVFSAMGFYPVNPAEGIYVFGTPAVDRAEISAGEKPFVMTAHNRSDRNIYIQSIRLDGKPYGKLYITHADIMRGAELEFEMGAEPADLSGLEVPPSVTQR